MLQRAISVTQTSLCLKIRQKLTAYSLRFEVTNTHSYKQNMLCNIFSANIRGLFLCVCVKYSCFFITICCLVAVSESIRTDECISWSHSEIHVFLGLTVKHTYPLVSEWNTCTPWYYSETHVSLGLKVKYRYPVVSQWNKRIPRSHSETHVSLGLTVKYRYPLVSVWSSGLHTLYQCTSNFHSEPFIDLVH